MPTHAERRQLTLLRRRKIQDRLKEAPDTSVAQLAVDYGVTAATITADRRWIAAQERVVSGPQAAREVAKVVQMLVDTVPVISAVPADSYLGAGSLLRLDLTDVDLSALGIDPRILRGTVRLWRSFLQDLSDKAGA